MCTRSILLINQDLDTVRICTDLFSTRGFDVVAVEGTEEGLRAARALAPAVIVAELLSRSEAGWEIIQALKGDPAVAAIPLVAFTAFALADDRRRARAADLFVAKPADLREVVAAVERFTRDATLSAPPEPPEGGS